MQLTHGRERAALLWRYEHAQWRILSGIFTPLRCTGSYCGKK